MALGMYHPKFHTAYERLQKDLERYLADNGIPHQKVHGVKDRFRERDRFVFRIFDEDGKEIGKVNYQWGGEDIIVVDVGDEALQRALTDEFSNGVDKFNDYVREWEHEFNSYLKEWQRGKGTGNIGLNRRLQKPEVHSVRPALALAA